ncbi:malto-oligosyltrehalose synthase [Actinophytocola oryzae]|uniref:Maltooligosyl trehalose synthase n=1 Tax=Actinophytocola oryzae TaxID=502181 RepID=A0A4R7VUY8_9PSEU|nr:malto-oligosyltrehalose synthase [Actinophytocola oryzae]TDV53674.1 maltooligosyl trehalose synthase [Actinophytocola oryzae]
MTPTSTYRLQINPGFDLTAAASTVDYLSRLGAGAVYTSPLLTAAPGSTHGYDVVDPTRASPELGGEPARVELMSRARAAGMGVVVDIVPNHMSVAVPAANPWWWDVLRQGRSSPYASYFDIDWSRGRIVLPVLGSDSLSDLKVDGDRLTYFEHEFPIAPGTSGGTPQEVHDRQHYRLAWWRTGNAELNYRRFFDITTLAGVRVEDPEVFEATHREVLRWVRSGDVTGLRIDHPDGLSDPGGYLRRLRAEAPETWLVTEKILAPDEPLPASWPAEGTTGYDALREICGLFVAPEGAAPLAELAQDLGLQPIGSPAPSLHLVEETCRRLVTQTSLVAEMRRIAALADVPPDAVAEIMIAFPVYRSYLPEGLDDWTAAVATARQKVPDLAHHVDTVDRAVRADPHGELATRVQQTSGMVVAKGVEDTAFYRWTPFIALNEVGGAPDRCGVTPTEFHTRASAREAAYPATMTALSTHDTKRAEDVRARLAVLSEIPDRWAEHVTRWSATHGIDEPSLNLLAWQTVVGAWPISADRLRGYLDKAAKEGKVRTSWVDHDEEFEAAVNAWPDRVITELGDEIESFVDGIRNAGWANALGQKIVQLAGPGVPDVYQGTELWDLSLVDPDNRRPVDFVLREELLTRLETGWLPDVDDTGAVKLHVVRQVLRLRRDRPDLFTGYRPLRAQGPGADHVVAFCRRPELVVVATRLPMSLDGWADTVLPLPSGPGNWRDLLTDTTVDTGIEPRRATLAGLLSRYPVALLQRGD